MKYPRIIQLSSQVANQIAAGEVVERPASVVKELVENALDAKASKIEIDIEGAGLHLIRVRDNGTGIVKEDLPLAIASHATSKIRTIDDLAGIGSMGFRGEALASIASVSRCRIISKPAFQDKAWQIEVNHNEPIVSLVAHPDGTTVEIFELFYNTPVRRKFLKSEKTEFQAIEEVVKRIALAFPHITFVLRHQQKIVRHFIGAKDPFCTSRLAKICSLQFAEQAASLNVQTTDLSLAGWLGFPQLSRRTADCQYFFVNQRMVKDRFIQHAIKTIYLESAQTELGTYPCFVLFLKIKPQEVDVNVHPTKQEVRFEQARFVHDFITKCVRDTLLQINNFTHEAITQPTPPSLVQTNKAHSTYSPRYSLPKTDYAQDAFITKINVAKHKGDNNKKRYVMLEEAAGIVIIDLVTAKKSLLDFYFKTQEITRKNLLFPLEIRLDNEMGASMVDRLAQAGFNVAVNKQMLKVLTQPQVLDSPVEEGLMKSVVTALLTERPLSSTLSNCPVTFDEALVEAWVQTDPTEGMLRLRHEEMAILTAKKAALA